MEVNEDEINQILGAMFTNSIDLGDFNHNFFFLLQKSFILKKFSCL